jgi:carbonic anhydrase/acetyltransferase-like protein (isoleucine patch superfamily)
MKPRLGTGVYVDPTALVIGNVTLGDDVSIWPQAVLRGDVNFIRVGARTNIQDGTVVHVSRRSADRPAGGATIVGGAVVVGHQVVVQGWPNGDRGLGGSFCTAARSATAASSASVRSCSTGSSSRTKS